MAKLLVLLALLALSTCSCYERLKIDYSNRTRIGCEQGTVADMQDRLTVLEQDVQTLKGGPSPCPPRR
jgi:hypothetical protein